MGYTTSQGAVISFSVDGAAASQRQIDGIAQSMSNLSNVVQNAMRNLAATAGIGGGLVQVVQLSDEYTKFTSQLHLATQSQREYETALGDVRRIAHDAQAELASTGVLYARISNGTRELAISQKQVADITEVVNLALRVSGATTEESASAQLQLSQAFAAGALRGEEFNAVNEAAPRLMKALADGIGVPIGALKQMASEGKITSEVLAAVLPKSLEQLRSEAQQVQTIGGAFTNLKNRVLEYTATTAQSNGSVTVLAGSIDLLSNNLALMAGTLTTVTAVKAANWSAAWVTEIYRKVAADQAGRAATLAAAQADLSRVQATAVQAAATQAAIVIAREEAMARLAQANANILAANAAIEAATAAGAQSFALRTLRLATGELQAAEASRGAMLAELAVLGQQQARVSAQITAARTAEAVATEAVAVAQTGGAAAAGLASRALGLLGGPVGAIVTVLGLAATAWSVYGSKSEEANKKAAETTEASTPEIVANLEKQNVKLRERLDLMKQGMPELAKDSSPAAERLASTLGEINALVAKSNELKAKGRELDAGDQAQLYALGLQYNNLFQALQQGKGLKAQIDATGSALTDLVAVRERLAGVDKQYFEDLGKLQTAREKGAITEKEYIDLVSKLATETYKKSEAGKSSIATLDKERDAYTRLVVAANEKIAATALEASGVKTLTESQKLQIAFDEELRKGKLKLSPEHKKAYQDLIDQLAANEAVIASQKRAAEGAAGYAKIIKDYNDAEDKKIADAEQEADRNEELARTFGLTKGAIAQLELARLEEQLAQRASTAMTLDEIERLEQLIAAKKRTAAALVSHETMEANKKAFDQMEADAKRSAEQIGQALTDNIMRGGKSAADYLKDLFRTLILRPVISPIGNAAGSMLTNALGGGNGSQMAAGASGNSVIGAAQTASSLYNAGKTLYSGFQSGIVGSLGTTVSSMGSMFGSSAASAYGAGIYGSSVSGPLSTYAADTFGAMGMTSEASAATAGMSAGSYAIPIAGWVMAGMALSNNLYKQGWDANNGSVNMLGKTVNGGMFIANDILKGIGLSNSAANILAGMGPISKLFGRKNPEVENSGIEGNFSSSGFSGDMYANILEKGGWFRSDKRYSKTAVVDTGLDASLDDTIKNMLRAVAGFGTQLGVETNQIDGYTKAIKLQLTDDDTKNQQLIAEMFSGIGDELAARLVPTIAEFQKTGETAATTLERLAGDFRQTDQVAQLLGFSADKLFGSAGLQSATAREQLIDLAGGVSVLSSQAAFFNQNFLTDAERIKPVAEALDKALATLGLATIPTTRDEFKTLVNDMIASGAVATETGSKQLTSLLALEEAFAQVHPQIDATADAVDEAAAAMQAMKDAASALLGGVDNAFSALQKVVAREKAALQSSIDLHAASVSRLQSLSQTLHGTLESIKSPDQKLAERDFGQATIRAALAIAKAGGPLPTTDSIKDALSAVAQNASSQFSSYEDYLRDLYQTQSDIAQLGAVTDNQLSVEQKALEAAQAQLDSLDAILTNAQDQIDVLKGVDVNGLTLVDAMRALTQAIVGAKDNPIVGATAAINGAYQQYLGRAPDAQGLEWWQNAAASGAPVSQIVDGIKGSTEATLNTLYQQVLGRAPDAEGLQFWMKAYGPTMDEAETADWMKAAQGSDDYKKLHPFAVGTNFVPETMPALVHQGERIIPAADNRLLTSLLARASNGGGESAAVAEELKALREEVKGLRAEARAIAGHTEKTSRITRALRGDELKINTEVDA